MKLFIPNFISNNKPNISLVTSKLLNKILLRVFTACIKLSDFLCFLKIEWFFTAAPTLLISVLHVFMMGSNKKMRWINASRIVAFMTNALANWYRANIYTIRHAMGKLDSVFKPKDPVAVFLLRCGPLPTRMKRDKRDIVVKSLFDIFIHEHCRIISVGRMS